MSRIIALINLTRESAKATSILIIGGHFFVTFDMVIL